MIRARYVVNMRVWVRCEHGAMVNAKVGDGDIMLVCVMVIAHGFSCVSFRVMVGVREVIGKKASYSELGTIV